MNLQLDYNVTLAVKDAYGNSVFSTECKLDELSQEIIIMEDEVAEYDNEASHYSYEDEDNYDDFGMSGVPLSELDEDDEQEEIKRIIKPPTYTKMELVPVKVDRSKLRK